MSADRQIARLDDDELRAWVQQGVDRGWVLRSGHPGWDGVTFVPTLVVQTTAVIRLHERGRQQLDANADALAWSAPSDAVQTPITPILPSSAGEAT